jgi:hypothetical protein
MALSPGAKPGAFGKWAGRFALIIGISGCLAPPALAGPPVLRGLGIDETLAGEALTAEALNQATLRASDLPVLARIVIQPSDLAGEEAHRFDALDARFERYRLKGVPVLMSFADPLPAPDAAEPWRQLLHAVADRYRGRVKAYELPAKGGPAAAVHEVAFVLRLLAVELRAADPDALLAIGPLGAHDRAWLEGLYHEDVAPYVDAVAVPGEGAAAAVSALEPLIAEHDPEASIFATGYPLPPDEAAAAQALLDWEVAHLGGRVSLTTYAAPSAQSLSLALNAAARIKDVLAADVVTLDDPTAGLRLTQGGEDVTASLRHSLLYDPGSLSTYLFYAADGRAGDLRVELKDATGLKPDLRDPLKAKSTFKVRNEWDATARRARVSVPLLDRLALLQLSYGGDNALVSRSEVTGSVLPSVAEIVFRHQLAQAKQDAKVESYTADARMEMHFRPSATDPGFDVITENRFFADRKASEWEETTFLLNGTRWGPKRPAFPMLQAEKVLSLPLDLKLSNDYLYKLLGLEKVQGRDAYAVRFDPVDESRSLYRGTVWIDVTSYAKLKVQTLQTRLSAPVVSSEETQFFDPAGEVDGLPIHLLSHFTTRQIMLVAGRNLLVERQVQFSKVAINPANFEAQRAAARGRDNIMYKDTDAGLRNFVKRAGTRVVEDRPTKSAKALAVGTIIDPSYDYPLPIVGLNYLNFDFLGHDNQLAVLFGGILALANVQRPKAIGDKISASVDLFAIAVASNDEVFGAGGENRGQRLRTHPFSTGLNLGWQADSFQKLSVSYQFRYDAYARDDGTEPGFTSPSSTVTNGFGLAYEYRRGGYTLQASGTHYRRGSWDPWGAPGDYEADQRTYEKVSGSFSKDFFFGAVHKVHLNAAYFGGRRLDRFSQYQFGLFEENRIHGVPSSGVRFGELAMFRASYSFNLLDLYGVDLFFDQAVGRAPQGGPWRSVTGLGLGFNLRGPKGTLLRGEIGKSFLPSSLNGAGSFVAQITLLKPL